MPPKIVPTPPNPVDTLFVLVSTALVLLMTPALALFYGGLARAKNILNTAMMSLAAFAVVGILWAVLGYSIAFAPGTALVGGFSLAALRNIGLETRDGTTIPHLLYFAYQGTFAVITAALISGAIVERMRFRAYLLFIGLWSLIVYAPVAHWVWGGGWLGRLGVLDFAGGTVVHITAGTAALVAASMVGPRRDYGRQAFLPHNVPMMLTGAALLWFGWVGFNGGSALAVNGVAVQATVNTILAPMAALATWLTIDLARSGRATAVGAGTAIVVGLVAITPACGFVSPRAALAIGAIAAIPCYFAILKRASTRLDDSLDVLGAHGTGGITGALLTGVFASAAWGGTDGLMHGNAALVGKQLLGVVATVAWTGLATWGILAAIRAVMPLRVGARDEALGLDVCEHGEEGYTDGEGAILVLQSADATPTAPLRRSA
ncbi:MAG: ammonium transporter [Gemmatimonadota bacterium]|nr:ammonium transporter [Gemmatimonadota bacterium]